MKKQEIDTKKTDLRKGERGSLTTRKVPLAGGDPIYSLENPPIASPDLRTPPGQATHE